VHWNAYIIYKYGLKNDPTSCKTQDFNVFFKLSKWCFQVSYSYLQHSGLYTEYRVNNITLEFSSRKVKLTKSLVLVGGNTYIDKGLHNVQAWEPGWDQGSHSKYRRLPAPCRKLRFKLFFPLKVNQLNLES